MKHALDSIFSDVNTPPFILRQLIQRFIAFNPSPAFAALIGAVFANNGSGIRDDVGAVINAILLDAEVLYAMLATDQCARLWVWFLSGDDQ